MASKLYPVTVTHRGIFHGRTGYAFRGFSAVTWQVVLDSPRTARKLEPTYTFTRHELQGLPS